MDLTLAYEHSRALFQAIVEQPLADSSQLFAAVSFSHIREVIHALSVYFHAQTQLAQNIDCDIGGSTLGLISKVLSSSIDLRTSYLLVSVTVIPTQIAWMTLVTIVGAFTELEAIGSIS